MSENPYAPPETPSPEISRPSSAATAVRRQLISHESSLKTIGLLYYLAGFFVAFAAFGLFLTIPEDGTSAAFVALFFLALAILQFVTGRGLRKLQSWARIPATLFSILGLFAFPVGTIINGYFLYLYNSRKGIRILSPTYREIIAQTPHVKHKTSPLTWIILIIVVLLAIAIPLFFVNS
ncbi:MAG: hypothetical protein ACSHYF_11215 [Verrucomicrobiaceae bacterium]